MEEYKSSYETKKVETKSTRDSVSLAMFKVYLWFALGLLVTGVVSIGLPNLLGAIVSSNPDLADTISGVYTGIIVVSVIMMLPSIIVINVQGFRKNRAVMITFYMLYAIAMGALLSTIILLVVGTEGNYNTICLAFFTTGLIFLLMGLIGGFTKKNLNAILPILASLMLGIFVISIVNWFLNSELIYYVVEYVMLAIMVIVVAVDTYNVKKIAQRGGFDNNTNLAIYCAFNLYYDFIWIFIRVVIALLENRN